MPGNPPPSIAIIIATRNAARDLNLTLDSIAAQYRRDAVEVFIQDGKPEDDTLDVARSYASRLPLLRMDSSPDNGVYDAWLKVLPLVRAPLDPFPRRRRHAVPSRHHANRHGTVGTLPARPHFRPRAGHPPQPEARPLYSMLNTTTRMAVALPYGNPIYHAGVFTRSDFLKEYPFDPTFKILGDYDFFCQHWENGARSWQLRCLVAEAPLGGLSNSAKIRSLHDAEMRSIRKRYFPLQYWTTRRRPVRTFSPPS